MRRSPSSATRCRPRPGSPRSGAPSTAWALPLKKTVHADEQRRPDVAAARRSGAPGSRCATLGSTSSSMNAASRPISCAATAAVRGAPGCTITRPVVIGKRTRWSPRAARRHPRPGGLRWPDRQSTFLAYVDKSWCRRFVAAMSSSSITSWSTNSPRSAPRSKPSGAPPLSSALQSRLQSDRARLRQTEGVPPRGPPRSFDQVCALIATALKLFTLAECRNFIRHCGYRVATAL